MFKVLLFFTLILAGCGVMNNPQDNKTAPEGAMEAGDSTAQNVYMPILLKYIQTDKLPITDANQPFIDSYQTYTLLTDKRSSDTFFTDLNNSAQTLLSKHEQTTVSSWITKTNDIPYSSANLLFYPITIDKDCNLTITNEDNQTFKITKNSCIPSPTFYPLFFAVDKTIPQVVLTLFGESNITIRNR